MFLQSCAHFGGTHSTAMNRSWPCTHAMCSCHIFTFHSTSNVHTHAHTLTSHTTPTPHKPNIQTTYRKTIGRLQQRFQGCDITSMSRGSKCYSRKPRRPNQLCICTQSNGAPDLQDFSRQHLTCAPLPPLPS